ncbi:hypothetical protein [Alicyclobacillus kakegawensis]|uniref:hypothetical protein n=1 Tax=Alicyclobacillus kakegawensis TaxID=392012 RepID=UPI000A9F5510|nr:hypothetical protein [Alicyclobacillus kakegawensis]
MPKVITLETLREQRRQGTHDIRVPYVSPSGEMKAVQTRIVNGEMEVFQLIRPIGEMITTPAGLDQLVQKTVVDLQLGREQVPLLYQPIYRNITDANLTEFVDISPVVGARVVFLQHMELEEVKFSGPAWWGRRTPCPSSRMRRGSSTPRTSRSGTRPGSWPS